MKIKKIQVYQVNLPYRGGEYQLSGNRSYRSFDATFVQIITDNGIEGWGESTPFGSNYIAAHSLGTRVGIEEIAPHLINEDPRLVDRINEKMDSVLLGHNHAKTAIDVACWDIFGKSVNMPVCDLLGGRTSDILPIISSIPAHSPDQMRKNVQEHRLKGYLGHSIKIGATEKEGGIRLDVERIKASLADTQQGEFFLVDANGGLTVESALRLLALLPQTFDFVLEAPCATWRESVSLRQRSSIPIMLDELIDNDASIIQLIADDVADGIGLKISKAGGLTHARRQRDICIAAGLTMSIQDTVGSEIAFAAILHLGQSVPKKNLRCILDTRDMVSLSTATINAEVKNGGVIAPNEPGLGITPKMKILGTPIQIYE